MGEIDGKPELGIWKDKLCQIGYNVSVVLVRVNFVKLSSENNT